MNADLVTAEAVLAGRRAEAEILEALQVEKRLSRAARRQAVRRRPPVVVRYREKVKDRSPALS